MMRGHPSSQRPQFRNLEQNKTKKLKIKIKIKYNITMLKLKNNQKEFCRN